jgi:predicted Zn finger-like uncharacterized protein
MKFFCDQCNTRYSIADERVRGKVLKIRCKSCSAIITVRDSKEEGSASTSASRDSRSGQDPAELAAADSREGGGPRRTTRTSQPAPASEASRAAAAETGAAPARGKAAPPPRPPARSKNGEKAAGNGKSTGSNGKLGHGGNGSGNGAGHGAGHGAGNGSALRGAFEKVMKGAPAAAETVRSSTPVPLEALSAAAGEAEWFLSVNGQQSGPYSLADARAWVAGRGAGEAVYCWSEGFDDWQSVERVKQLSGLRSESGASRGARAAVDTASEEPTASLQESPQALFAATMAPLESDGGSGGAPAGGRGDGDLDFDIGEASRVVNIADVINSSRPARLGNGTGANLSMPRSAAPTGAVKALSVPAEPASPPRRRSHMVQIAIGTMVLASVGGVLAFLAFGRSREREEDRLTRSRIASEDLGYSFDQPDRRSGDKGPEGKSRTAATRSSRPASTRVARTAEAQPAGRTTSGSAALADKVDDIDLGPAGGGVDASRPLDEEDLVQTVRKNQVVIKMCYNHALKKDPLLEVSRADVAINIAPSGQVTKVNIPTLRGTELGNCLVSRISKWRFRASPEVFSTQFPIIFRN